ncbi:MAG: COP23 domain-containing protein [Oculatellaceae cyanobacterium bins.114]|nr:COP23 domain-containing protein [Oculatellaceae cyanobacterium bins.114]
MPSPIQPASSRKFRQAVIRVAAAAVSLSVSTLLISGTALAAIATGNTSPAKQSSSGDSTAPRIEDSTRFACQTVNGEYTVMYYPESQPNQAYAWAVPSLLGGGWTPQRRCAEISRRLESYRPDGLQELRTGTENGYNVICATTERNSGCRIVLTVPPGQDPVATRDRVFENLAVADSGQQTDGVNTYSGRGQDDLFDRIGEVLNLPSRRRASNGIDLRPFLDRADGGTGARLQGGFSTQSNPDRLNPNNFR